MSNKTLMMKLIAVILVLMLSLSNFLVLVSYAAEISFESKVDLDSQDAKTNNKNVYFDSYFKNNDNKTYSKKLNVEETNKVYVKLALPNGGYLKTATINFEEESFNIKKQEELGNIIQAIDYDKKEIAINQINAGTEVELEIPIEIAKSEVYNIQNLNKNNKVQFTGTYITEKGKEVEIEKEIYLGVQWDADIDGMLEQNLSKYISGIDGKTLVEFNLESYIQNNILPVKEINIEIEVPEIEAKAPKYINALGASNFEYNETEKKVKINIQNLPNEQSEIIWKEEIDKSKLILVYEGLVEDEKIINLNSKVSFDVYGKNEKIEKQVNSEIVLNQNIGNINEVNITSDKSEIYKSFMYANSEYETEYKLNWKLNVGLANVSNKIIISDIKETFINNNEEKIGVSANSYYKQTIINRRNFENILGQDGYIKIFNEANKEIANITLSMTEDENIVINYQNQDLNKIKIETSNPITEGSLEIGHVKSIKAQTDYEKETIKTFTKLENEVNLNTIYNKVIENDEEQDVEEINITNINSVNTINLLEPETKVEIKINKDSLVTGTVNEDVEIYINLINNEEKYSLFTNPVFDIRLPEEIAYMQIENLRLVFEEEIVIQNTEVLEDENGIKYIRISLNGNQTKYNIGNIISGASIILTGDIGLKEIEETKQSALELICTNDNMSANSKVEINLVKVEMPEEEVVPEEEQKPEEGQEPEQEEEVPENQEEEQEDPEEIPEQEEQESPENPEQIPEVPEENEEQIPEVKPEQNENLLRAEVKLSSDKSENAELKWGEIITYKVTVENDGETLNNASLIVELPEGLNYMAEEEAFEPLFYEEKQDVRTIKWNLEEVLVGREVTKEFKAVVKKDANNIEVSAKLFDNDTKKENVSNVITNNCKQGNMILQLANNMQGIDICVDDTFNYQIKINELLGEKLSNVSVELQIPEGINCYDAYITDGFSEIKDNINISNNLVQINLAELLPNEEKYIFIECDAKNILNTQNRDITAQAKISADGIEETLSNISINGLSKPVLEVKQYSNLEENKANAGDLIKHIIEVKNVGVGTADNITIEDNFSEGVRYLSTIYTKGNKLIESKNYDGETSRIITSLGENESLIAVVTMQAAGGNTDIENFVEVSANGIDTVTTEKEVYKLIDIDSNSGNSTAGNNNNSSNNNQGNNNNNNNVSKANVSGSIWIDENRNGIKEAAERKVEATEVYLVNVETNNQISTKTNSVGEFTFANTENGKYMIVAPYNSEKYSLTKPYVEYADSSMISKGIRADARINNESRVVAVIENINVQDGNVTNQNIGLIENEIFDLSLNKVVDNIEVQTKKGTSMYNQNKKLAKVEIHAKEIEGAVAKITYRFDIKNEGDIPGTATKILENIPEGLNINLAENPGWKMDEKGLLYNTSLAGEVINSGETKSIYLVLTKTMTEDNTGIINNIAEIGESQNKSGIKDKDSVAGNNNKTEDDLSYADVYIGIKTGKTILYISLGLSMLIVLSVGIYLINKKVLQY